MDNLLGGPLIPRSRFRGRWAPCFSRCEGVAPHVFIPFLPYPVTRPPFSLAATPRTRVVPVGLTRARSGTRALFFTQALNHRIVRIGRFEDLRYSLLQVRDERPVQDNQNSKKALKLLGRGPRGCPLIRGLRTWEVVPGAAIHVCAPVFSVHYKTCDDRARLPTVVWSSECSGDKTSANNEPPCQTVGGERNPCRWCR